MGMRRRLAVLVCATAIAVIAPVLAPPSGVATVGSGAGDPKPVLVPSLQLREVLRSGHVS